MEERSRAFGYLVAMGSIGQTVAAMVTIVKNTGYTILNQCLKYPGYNNLNYLQVCPHLHWPWMFYSFGILGFVWVIFWILMYKEVRGPVEEEFIQPPKVSVYSVLFATCKRVMILSNTR